MVDRQKLKKNLCSAFGVNGHYRSLPMAHGPAPSQGVQLLRDALIRPAKYNEKFLPQEYSLLHKAWVLLGRDCSNAGILDIGAGNACCAVLAATLLGLTVICVERESPRIELRAEAQLPPKLQNRVIRLESDVADFGLSALKQIVAERGLEVLSSWQSILVALALIVQSSLHLKCARRQTLDLECHQWWVL